MLTPTNPLVQTTTSRYSTMMYWFLEACSTSLYIRLDHALDHTELCLVPWGHRVPPRANCQPPDTGTCMAQSKFQFIEGPVIDWSVDDLIPYISDLRCENLTVKVYWKCSLLAWKMWESARHFLVGQVTRIGVALKSLLKLCGKQGKSFASHKLINLGQYMTFWSHAHRIYHVWISDAVRE